MAENIRQIQLIQNVVVRILIGTEQSEHILLHALLVPLVLSSDGSTTFDLESSSQLRDQTPELYSQLISFPDACSFAMKVMANCRVKASV